MKNQDSTNAWFLRFKRNVHIFYSLERKIPFLLPWFLLTIVLIAFLLIAVWESTMDQGYEEQDDSYLGFIENATHYIQGRNLSLLFLSYYDNYPPAFFSTSALVLPDRWNVGRPAIRFLTWFWFIIGLVGTFLFLAPRLKIWGTLWVVTLFVASPCFRYGLKYLTIDSGLVALFPWLLFALDRSESFQSRAWSVSSAFLLSFGMLMRFDFLLLSMLPILFQIKKNPTSKSWRNVLFFGLLSTCLILVFLIFAKNRGVTVQFIPRLHDLNLRGWIHLQMIYKSLFPPAFIVLAFAGWLVGMKKEPKKAGFLLLLFFVPVAFYSLFWFLFTLNNSFGDYLWNYKYMLIPVLMLCAIAGYLGTVSSKWFRIALPIILLATGLPLVENDFEVQPPKADKPKHMLNEIRSIEPLQSMIPSFKSSRDPEINPELTKEHPQASEEPNQ